MDLPPLLVELRLTNLDRRFFSYVDPLSNVVQKPLYLWVIYFKIDGDSVFLGPDLKLHGNAIIFDRSGNHGDIHDPGLQANVPIPNDLGEFHTTLRPIPVDPSVAAVAGMAIPGFIGCIALIWLQWDTSDDVIAAGHAALNSTFQQQLNALIPTLGAKHLKVTPDDIQNIQDAIQSAVEDAIKSTLSDPNKLFTWLGFEKQDVYLADFFTSGYTYRKGGPAFLIGQDELLAASSRAIRLEAILEGLTLGENSLLKLEGQAHAWTPFWLDGFGSFQPLAQLDLSFNGDLEYILVLGSDRNLWLEHAPFGNVPPKRQQVDGNVQAFQASDIQTVFVLGTDGNLWYTPAPFGQVPNPNRIQIDGNVQAFQMLDNETVLVLGTDGKLWLEHAPFGNVPPKRETIDENVLTFQGLDSETVLILGTDGNLWYTPAPFGQVPNPSRLQVDGNVQAFQGSTRFSDIFVLGTDGKLWSEHAPFGAKIPPDRTPVDSHVRAFQVLSLPDFVWVLGSDRKLWLEQRPFGQVPPQRQLISTNVRAFQPVDLSHIVVLGTNNKLWLEQAPFGNVPPVEIDANVR